VAYRTDSVIEMFDTPSALFKWTNHAAPSSDGAAASVCFLQWVLMEQKMKKSKINSGSPK